MSGFMGKRLNVLIQSNMEESTSGAIFTDQEDHECTLKIAVVKMWAIPKKKYAKKLKKKFIKDLLKTKLNLPLILDL
jgi:hypothetical protein